MSGETRDSPLIHIIDDDLAVRNSLAFLLEAHEMRTRTYESADRFFDDYESQPDNCIITDVRMPGISGIEVVRLLRARGVLDPVIIMTGEADVAVAVQALRAGVSDFIEKPFDDELMLSAIRTALARRSSAGEIGLERTRIAALIASLSGRETEVLDGLLEGKSNKLIARDLGISSRTVEVYRANVMIKTGAKALSELVRMVTIARIAA